MGDVRIPARIEAVLVESYAVRQPRVAAIYARSTAAQWNVADLDWAGGIEHGTLLAPGGPGFTGTALERHGPRLWHDYQWEFQSWMVSQFLHGEQGALIAAARLVEVVPGVETKACAAAQAADEARHVDAFARYIDTYVPHPYVLSDPLGAMLADTLSDSRWDVTMLGVQIMVEALALGAFRMADRTFADPLVRSITRLVARDEARHVSFGVLSLQDAYADLTAAERAEREDIVLAAADAISRRFLLSDVWERLGVPVPVGREVARTDPMMVAYRRAVFTKVVTSLDRIGLLTPRVRAGFAALGLTAARARPVPQR